MTEPTILIHGGAGTMHPDRLTPERRTAILQGLRRALTAGQSVLRDDGSAIEAVVAAVPSLEDDPNFNAGRGAVFTSADLIEMDAAIMDGRSGRLGAVAGILGPRNPVRAAQYIMQHSPHVLLAGPSALDLLRAAGLPFETLDYFATEERRTALDLFLTRSAPADDFDRHGTVGAVALDAAGALAAATSTGGMTGKQPGRIGDSPIAG
ncbi:MAG: isoaspartyl peptidase/L-asparaginase, partial [Pseudomonadota bacterium]|nr:isoaspartyl peptidase/L-asparaginase [Pseudomonadota bacterium]